MDRRRNQDQEEGAASSSSPLPYVMAKEQLDYLSSRSSAMPDYLPYSYQRTAPYLLWDELSSHQMSSTSSHTCSCCCCRAATIVLAIVLLGSIFAIIGIAAYLGFITNTPEMYILEEEIYEGQMRVVSGDRYAAGLSDRSSPQYTIKVESYESLLNEVYHKSSLKDAFLRSKVLGFQNGSLVVFFRLHLDRRKLPSNPLQETYSILHKEVQSSKPVVFKNVHVEASTLNISNIHGDGHKITDNSLEVKLLLDDDDMNVTDLSMETKIDHENASGVTENNTTVSSEYESTNLLKILNQTVIATTTHEPASSSTVRTRPVVNDTKAAKPAQGSISEINFDWEPEEAVSAIFREMQPKSNEESLQAQSDTSQEFGFRIQPPKQTAQSRSDTFDFQIDSPQIVINTESKRRSNGNRTHFSSVDIQRRRGTSVDGTATTKSQWIPIPPRWQPQEAPSGEFVDSPNDDEKSGFGLRLSTSKVPLSFSSEEIVSKNWSSPAVVVKLPSRTRRPVIAPFGPEDRVTSVPHVGRRLQQARMRAHSQRPRFVDVESALARSARVLGSEARIIPSVKQHGNIIVASPLRVNPGHETNEVRVTRTPKLSDVIFDPPVEELVTSISVKSSSSVVVQSKATDVEVQREVLPATLTSVVTSVEEATEAKVLEHVHHSSEEGTIPLSYAEMIEQQGDTFIDVFPDLLKLAPLLRSSQTSQPSTTETTADELDVVTVNNMESNITSENEITSEAEVQQSTTESVVFEETTLDSSGSTNHRPSLFEQLYSSLFSSNGGIFTNDAFSDDSSDENLVLSTNSEELKNYASPSSLNEDYDNSSASFGLFTTFATKTTNQRCESPTLFKCRSGECVSIFSRCNRMRDCADNSDEDDCACADFVRANVINSTLCDGVVDCWDYSDENQCEWCSPSMFVCPTARVCVEKEKVCDGVADCPGGEDERSCVTVAPNMTVANSGNYWGDGLIMIRRDGRWGKLCMENFENFVSEAQVATGELGRVLCQTMGYSDFEEAKQLQDHIPRDDSSIESIYYEPQYSENKTEFRSSPSIQFVPTSCHSKEVIRVMCRDFVCGKRHQSIQSRARIVGGSNSTPGSWPWQAAVYKEGNFMCGATLISDKWLISAAHCFYQAVDHYWAVRLGILRRGSFSPYERVHKVSHIILHPNYISSNFINDIALLRMNEPVNFSDFIRPICLSDTDLTRGSISKRQSCTVVGWGQIDEEGDYLPDTLQEVKLPLISARECRMRTTALTSYARVNDNMFCAGVDHGGHDACLGDSGGPIMCQQSDGRWALTGITSNGFGCARASRPGIYTKVASYLPWIQKVKADPLVRSVRNFCNGHRCLLGKCLSKRQVCDGFVDCIDGSDEVSCSWSRQRSR